MNMMADPTIIGSLTSIAEINPEIIGGIAQANAIIDWFIPSISPWDFSSAIFETSAVRLGWLIPLNSAMNGTM